MDLMIEDDFVLPDNPDAPLCVGSSLPWLFDKGEVDDQGEVLRPCDERFLIELLLKMEKAYETVFQFTIKYEDPEESDSGEPASAEEMKLVAEDIHLAMDHASADLVEIAREIRRLQRYQGVFPGQSAMETFHSALHSKLALEHHRSVQLAGKIESESCCEKLHKAEYLIELWLKHPTFQYDLKPWEQFLNQNAPGSGMNPRAKFLGKVPESEEFEVSSINERSSFQILPPGALAVLADWKARHDEVYERIHQTLVPARLRSNARRPTGGPPNIVPRHMRYTRETLPFRFQPNLWHPQRPEGLEIFPENDLPFRSSLIAALEDLDNFDDPDEPLEDDPVTMGVLVASNPSEETSVLHHEVYD